VCSPLAAERVACVIANVARPADAAPCWRLSKTCCCPRSSTRDSTSPRLAELIQNSRLHHSIWATPSYCLLQCSTGPSTQSWLPVSLARYKAAQLARIHSRASAHRTHVQSQHKQVDLKHTTTAQQCRATSDTSTHRVTKCEPHSTAHTMPYNKSSNHTYAPVTHHCSNQFKPSKQDACMHQVQHQSHAHKLQCNTTHAYTRSITDSKARKHAMHAHQQCNIQVRQHEAADTGTGTCYDKSLKYA
jgi:hypothetical protein